MIVPCSTAARRKPAVLTQPDAITSRVVAGRVHRTEDSGSGRAVVVPGPAWPEAGIVDTTTSVRVRGLRKSYAAAAVKTHLLRAFGMLGVSDRTVAVTTAIERGDIPPPGR